MATSIPGAPSEGSERLVLVAPVGCVVGVRTGHSLKNVAAYSKKLSRGDEDSGKLPVARVFVASFFGSVWDVTDTSPEA